MLSHPAFRWTLLAVIILAIILVPYALFGGQIEAWTESFLERSAEESAWIVTVLALLLAGDILLPVPSSLASTAAGIFGGFFWGATASWLGMTVSCTVGYWLARMGRPVVRRLVGKEELQRLEVMNRRVGGAAVVLLCRAVPVLAEASVLFTGTNKMPFGRFFLLAALANLSISVVYAAVGAFSATVNSFLLAFFGSILVLGLVTVGVQLQARERRRATRVPARYPVTYTLYDDKGGIAGQGQAQTIDISGAGLSLDMTTPVAAGSRMLLELQDQNGMLALSGRVAHARRLPNGHLQVGIQLEKLSAQAMDRLETDFIHPILSREKGGAQP